MRLFLAVELADSLRESAGRIAERVARELGPGARRAVTWVAPPRMHLTVRFLGEVDAATAALVAARLVSPLATPAFQLSLSGLGAFPPSGPPRVIWLGLSEGQESLARVHREIEDRLGEVGFEKEERAFRAHLTLGRVKAPLGAAARAVLAAVPAASVGSCTIDHVTLFQSRLSAAGPSYAALARCPLATGIEN